MSSVIGWLDHSEDQQRRMREVIALFADSSTVDDIGIGVVRDAFADLLFPGLSTVQTRVRYFLFVPWVYQRLVDEKVRPDQAADRARTWEVELIFALLRGGSTEGVIGREARSDLKQLPSYIYWNGLRSFGIRTFTGTRNDYFRSLGRATGGGSATSRWHPNLPAPPVDLFERASLRLRPEDAAYLQERFVAARPQSLLAHLARRPRPLERERFPWDAVDPAEVPEPLRSRLRAARSFSETIHGAALLYNLLLAETAASRGLPHGEERLETYRSALADWQGLVEAGPQPVGSGEIWTLFADAGTAIPWPARQFVSTWVDAVAAGADVEHDTSLRRLVVDRERRLKKSQSRLANPRALEMWGGASGAARLTYRWAEARDAITDLADGLGVS